MTNAIFSVGKNIKIGGGTTILNLPPIKTCTNCSTCASSCYANFRYQYPSVKKRWDNNLIETKKSSFVEKATIELKYLGSNIVRYHESGDFYNDNYINKCYKLAKACPSVMFFGYTKNKNALKLNKLSNVNVIYSFIDSEIGLIRNYGNKDYCNYLHEHYNTFICPHDDSWKKQGKKCMVDCKESLTCNNVAFVQHGRKAKSDPYSKETLAKLKGLK